MKRILIIAGISLVGLFILLILYFEFFTVEAYFSFRNNTNSPVTLLKRYTGETDTVVQEIFPGNEVMIGNWEVYLAKDESKTVSLVSKKIDMLKVIMPDNSIRDLLICNPVRDSSGTEDHYYYQVE